MGQSHDLEAWPWVCVAESWVLHTISLRGTNQWSLNKKFPMVQEIWCYGWTDRLIKDVTIITPHPLCGRGLKRIHQRSAGQWLIINHSLTFFMLRWTLTFLQDILLVSNWSAPHTWQRSGSHSRTARKHGHCLVLHWALQRHPGKRFWPENERTQSVSRKLFACWLIVHTFKCLRLS